MIHEPEELYGKTLKLLKEQRQVRLDYLLSAARKSTDPVVRSSMLLIDDLDYLRDSLITIWKGPDGTDSDRTDD